MMPAFLHAVAPCWNVTAVVARWRLDIIASVLVILSYGGLAMVRVVAGQCPAGASMFVARTCNPYADALGVPPEDSVFLFMMPIMVQMALRSIPTPVLVLMWVLVLASVGCAVGYVNAVHHLWVPVLSVFFITVSFKLQRLQRVAFRVWEQISQVPLLHTVCSSHSAHIYRSPTPSSSARLVPSLSPFPGRTRRKDPLRTGRSLFC